MAAISRFDCDVIYTCSLLLTKTQNQINIKDSNTENAENTEI
jgi:hypothetical protein